MTDFDDLGSQLVKILYENTNMNYDVCAEKLIKIFTHLETNVEKLELTSFKQISDSINNSITDPKKNLDFVKLDEFSFFLKNTSDQLKSGDSSYLDYEERLEKVLLCIRDILLKKTNQSSLKNFSIYFSSNREFVLTLYEIWKNSGNNRTKCKIIHLLTIIFHSDSFHIQILYLNTNIVLDLCFNLKDQIKLNESLKELNLIEDVFNLIEENNEFIYKNVFGHTFTNFLTIKQYDNTLLDYLVYFILSLNSKFSLPEENIVLQYLLEFKTKSKDYSVFSEKIVSLFNLEDDPLCNFKFQNCEITQQTLYNDCLIKMVSDLFSSERTLKTTSIFYYNDYKVLIDVILRKLNNLSASDQIRSDYLSLMDLIIKNSCYLEEMYKIDELLTCFNSILNERDQYTIDQDIIRVILSETPELLTKNI